MKRWIVCFGLIFAGCVKHPAPQVAANPPAANLPVANAPVAQPAASAPPAAVPAAQAQDPAFLEKIDKLQRALDDEKQFHSTRDSDIQNRLQSLQQREQDVANGVLSLRQFQLQVSNKVDELKEDNADIRRRVTVAGNAWLTQIRANRKKPLDDFVPCELNDLQTDSLKLTGDLSEIVDDLIKDGYKVNRLALAQLLEKEGIRAGRYEHAFVEAFSTGAIVPPASLSREEGATRGIQKVSRAISAAAAPDDVGCSMVPLTWEIAADSFGRHVADQYIAFQVTVRNLNATQEFLLHNVNIAIDNQRFYASVDKMIVRHSQDHGLYYDRRNYFMRGLEVAGDIAAGAATYGSMDTQSGIGIFRSAFIPGLGKIFRDRSTDQLQALNDLAFSSASAYKIVIPVKGSAPFVTFLPAKIFGLQHGKTAASLGKNWHYKNWDADALHAFAENAFIIAAGIHVLEVHNDDASVTAVDCKGANGAIQLSTLAADAQSLTCAVKGQNLDKLSKLRLKNADESTDTNQAEAPVTAASGDTANATAVFPLSQLRALTGTSYAVYTVGPKGTENITSLKVAVVGNSDAQVTVKVGSADCAETNCDVTVHGNNLGQATGFFLFNAASATAPIETGTVTVLKDGTGVTVHLTRLANQSGSLQLKLKQSTTEVASVTLALTLIPQIDSLDPSAYPGDGSACMDGTCTFKVNGKRLAALTSVTIGSDPNSAASKSFDAKTSTLTFAKADMDKLPAGAQPVAGMAGTDQAVSNTKLTVTAPVAANAKKAKTPKKPK